MKRNKQQLISQIHKQTFVVCIFLCMISLSCVADKLALESGTAISEDTNPNVISTPSPIVEPPTETNTDDRVTSPTPTIPSSGAKELPDAGDPTVVPAPPAFDPQAHDKDPFTPVQGPGEPSSNLPPTAVILKISPTSVQHGVTVYFYGYGNDPEGSKITYNWSSSIDHLLSTKESFNTSTLSVGRHSITFITTDDHGAVSTPATATILVNTPPVANPGSEYFRYLHTPLLFDGSQSHDIDGTIISYHWNFGDGTTGNGVQLTHTYDTKGTYTVTLTVTDNLDATNTATTTATIVSSAPVANANGPYNGTVNHTLIFNASKSRDLDGSLVSYNWDFGDGFTGTGLISPHAYTSVGIYKVILDVTDNNGYTGRDTTVAVIINQQVSLNTPPHKPLLTIIGKDNTTLSFMITFNDADQDACTIIINWGDSSTTTTPGFPSGTNLTVTHTWSTPGLYTIQATARDSHNVTSEMTKLLVLIGNTTQATTNNPTLVSQNPPILFTVFFIGVLVCIIISTARFIYTRKKKQSQN